MDFQENLFNDGANPRVLTLIEAGELGLALKKLRDFVNQKDLEKLEKSAVEIGNFVKDFTQVFRLYFDENCFTVDFVFSNSKLRKIEQLSREINDFVEFYNPSRDKSVVKEKIWNFIKHFKEIFRVDDGVIVAKHKPFNMKDLIKLKDLRI